MTAQHSDAAIGQLELLAEDPQYAPVALRLTGLIEFQQGRLDAAAASFEAAQNGEFPEGCLLPPGADRGAARGSGTRSAFVWPGPERRERRARPAARPRRCCKGTGPRPRLRSCSTVWLRMNRSVRRRYWMPRARMYADAGDFAARLGRAAGGSRRISRQRAVALCHGVHRRGAGACFGGARELSHLGEGAGRMIRRLGMPWGTRWRITTGHLARARRLIDRAYAARRGIRDSR